VPHSEHTGFAPIGYRHSRQTPRASRDITRARRHTPTSHQLPKAQNAISNVKPNTDGISGSAYRSYARVPVPFLIDQPLHGKRAAFMGAPLLSSAPERRV
jgi:hypothetical protein